MSDLGEADNVYSEGRKDSDELTAKGLFMFFTYFPGFLKQYCLVLLPV